MPETPLHERPFQGVGAGSPDLGPNPFAVGSLVCGVLSLFCACFCYGFPFNIISFVLGLVAIFGHPNPNGRSMAYVGMGLGALSFVLAIAMAMLGFAGSLASSILQSGNY